jgi:hypothetical protein
MTGDDLGDHSEVSSHAPGDAGSGWADSDRANKEHVPFTDRLRTFFLKPPAPGEKTTPREPETAEEFAAAVKSANDKERLLGLIAAPLAAAIGILIIAALISNDPAARLADGALNKSHVNVSLYHELELVLLAMSVVMLVLAMLRKRLYLGMVMALYGLAVFNLHYWGFGIPFLMGGSWLLVRAYRLQRSLKEVNGDVSSFGSRSRATATTTRTASRPRPNKRYTPPRPSRTSRVKPANKVRADGSAS